MNSLNPDKIFMYTDGSCCPNPGKGGWGCIGIFDDYDIELNGGEIETTSSRMELTAVLEGVIFFDAKEYTIYTDSQYVIKGFSGEWKKTKNLDLWKKLETSCVGKKINFVWVKGHNGDIYNERVDILAKEGRKKI